uniref:Predicted protein n=1 Tax=Hordeum vulgare subsp. vulgare TaxID=112509 RepID=F2DYD0_HORVV|nr:predicted protein [Hordeum vulgare subsp. vulgare]
MGGISRSLVWFGCLTLTLFLVVGVFPQVVTASKESAAPLPAAPHFQSLLREGEADPDALSFLDLSADTKWITYMRRTRKLRSEHPKREGYLEPWRIVPLPWIKGRRHRSELGPKKDGFVPIPHPKLKARSSFYNPYWPTYRHGKKEPLFWGPSWMRGKKTAHFTREAVPLAFAVVPQYRKYTSLVAPATPFDDGPAFAAAVDRGRAHFPVYQLGSRLVKDELIPHVEQQRRRLFNDASVKLATKADALVHFVHAPGQLEQPVKSQYVPPFSPDPNDPRTKAYVYIPRETMYKRLHDIQYRFTERRDDQKLSANLRTSQHQQRHKIRARLRGAKRAHQSPRANEPVYSSPVEFPNMSPPPPHTYSNHLYNRYDHSRELFRFQQKTNETQQPQANVTSAADKARFRATNEYIPHPFVLDLRTPPSAGKPAAKPAITHAADAPAVRALPHDASPALFRFQQQRLRQMIQRVQQRQQRQGAGIGARNSGDSHGSGHVIKMSEAPLEYPVGNDPLRMTEPPRVDPWAETESNSIADRLAREAHGAMMAEPKLNEFSADPGGLYGLSQQMKQHMEDNDRRPQNSELVNIGYQWDTVKPLKVFGLSPSFVYKHFGKQPIANLSPLNPAAISASPDSFTYGPRGNLLHLLLSSARYTSCPYGVSLCHLSP